MIKKEWDRKYIRIIVLTVAADVCFPMMQTSWEDCPCQKKQHNLNLLCKYWKYISKYRHCYDADALCSLRTFYDDVSSSSLRLYHSSFSSSDYVDFLWLKLSSYWYDCAQTTFPYFHHLLPLIPLEWAESNIPPAHTLGQSFCTDSEWIPSTTCQRQSLLPALLHLWTRTHVPDSSRSENHPADFRRFDNWFLIACAKLTLLQLDRSYRDVEETMANTLAYRCLRERLEWHNSVAKSDKIFLVWFAI